MDVNELNNVLVNAAKDGDIDTVLYALSKNADVHYNDNDAIQWAARNGHEEVVDLLITFGADSKNHNAMQWALTNGHYDIVKMLERSPIYTDGMYIDHQAETAANYNDLDWLIRIIDDNSFTQEQLNDFLESAVSNNNLNMINYLLSIGAQITDESIYIAESNDHYEMYKYLIESIPADQMLNIKPLKDDVKYAQLLIELGNRSFLDDTNIILTFTRGRYNLLSYLVNVRSKRNIDFNQLSYIQILDYLKSKGVFNDNVLPSVRKALFKSAARSLGIHDMGVFTSDSSEDLIEYARRLIFLGSLNQSMYLHREDIMSALRNAVETNNNEAVKILLSIYTPVQAKYVLKEANDFIIEFGKSRKSRKSNVSRTSRKISGATHNDKFAI